MQSTRQYHIVGDEPLHRLRNPDKDRVLWIDSVCIFQADVAERNQQVAKMHKIYSNGVRNLIWLGPDDGTVISALESIRALNEDMRAETDNFTTLTQWLYHKQAVLPSYTAAYESLNDYVVNAALLANFCDPDFGWFKKASTSTRPQGVLFALLDNLARFETRNPRDRIFGLLGLYQHLAAPPQPEPLLRIDYEKSTIDVFRDATMHSINEMGRLDPLSWVQHRVTTYGMLLHPTWVPSWHRKWDGKLDASLLSTFFNASLDHPIDIRTAKDPSKLRLTGLLVDGQGASVVDDLTDVCLDSGALPQFFNQAFSLWENLTDNETPDTASLAMTLIAGRDSRNQAATSEILDGFRDFQRRLQTSPRPPRRRRSLTQHPITLPRHQHTPVCRYREACWNACHRRRFFTTRGGRFGIGPQVMQTGDVVVVLYGGQWPFVLRPVDGSTAYELVGQCYVHDVMFGEAMERHKAKGGEDVVFDIL
ncbi:hypothetical protein PRZ48_010163 [Zasmidium cellare]|uniref:Heterokaryon incompatibility domain-containing protein n=1 Tax=Zasmidium cellare TaxID=395010 RepID=A0ABR0EEC6_ZASCE|nr:hypothetical protein PRZ48_010163 [Zasmidium cellare]